MSNHHTLEMEMQSTEKTAAQAQDIMSSLKEAAMMNPTMKGYKKDAAQKAAAAIKTSAYTSTIPKPPPGAEKSKRSKILTSRKQKIRYRNGGGARSSQTSAELLRQTQSQIVEETNLDEDVKSEGGGEVQKIHDVRLSKSEDVRAIAKKLDKYGFIVNMDSNGQVYQPDGVDDDDESEIPSFAQTMQTQRREKQWHGMMATWEVTRRRRKRLSKSLRKGIPDALRGSVWTLLGNVPKKVRQATVSFDVLVRKSLDSAGQGPRNASMQRMRSESLVNSAAFHVTQETIERDIHRTYPRHDLFHEDAESSDEEGDGGTGGLLDALDDDEVGSILKQLDNGTPRLKHHHHHSDQVPMNFHEATGGQAALRRVLRAYSVYDRDVGYCQGMNFIAGMFLTFMSEEEAFWLLVFVMNDPPCQMRGLFGEGMKETHMVLFIAEKLTYQFLPKLAKHMEAQSIHITMYATQWLLTLYTSSFQFDLVTRVWDCFLAEGYKVVYRVMLALLQESQAALLMLTFEDILAHFRELPKITNGNKIMEVALKIPLRHKHLSKYQKEFFIQQQQQRSSKSGTTSR